MQCNTPELTRISMPLLQTNPETSQTTCFKCTLTSRVVYMYIDLHTIRQTWFCLVTHSILWTQKPETMISGTNVHHVMQIMSSIWNIIVHGSKIWLLLYLDIQTFTYLSKTKLQKVCKFDTKKVRHAISRPVVVGCRPQIWTSSVVFRKHRCLSHRVKATFGTIV